MKVLVCVEAPGDEIGSVFLELISAARSLSKNAEVVACVIGNRPEKARDQLGGADRLILVETSEARASLAHTAIQILENVYAAERPDLVLVAYTPTGLDVAADLAARTGIALISYVVGLEPADGGLVAQSLIYSGKLVARVALELPAVLMINPGSFPEAAGQAAEASTISRMDFDGGRESGGAITLLSESRPDGAEIDLSKAARIVALGRGIGDPDGIELARELASLIGAEIAGSRPVVDSGWLPRMRQVGKSGQKVKPKLYLALGISGAPEHLEGMAQSDLIIAINTDANAPIFNVAQYGATCDLFDLMDSLGERLRERLGS